MRKSICLAFVLLATLSVRAADPPTLPPAVARELKALGETYVLLDAVAEKVWPGWTGYRDWPFLFMFENGLRVLVGHPNPPKPFEVVTDVRVGERSVAVDRSAVTAVALSGPFVGGGGLGSFGATAAGAPVQVINMRYRNAPRSDDKAAAPGATESRILTYLHEMFHTYQRRFDRMNAGNLMYNADIDYAVWSNIEGLALDRAYGETDVSAARERVKEFLVARSLKRHGMTDEQQNDESYDDAMEGTANYVMVRTLEVVKGSGFRPTLTTAEDPGYGGFANVEPLLAQYRAELTTAAAGHAYPKGKCYQYGCFQGLLCERLAPGWQAQVQKGQFIDAILAARLPISEEERPRIEQRLKQDYPYAAIHADAAKFIDARDGAWTSIKARTGRTYIVDMKSTGQAVAAAAAKPAGTTATSYALGVITLYPAGFPGLSMNAVDVSATTVPALADQLYYLKIVDTQPAAGKPPYSVSGSKQPDGTWLDAIVTTPLFTVKAPKLRVRETASRIKIQVLPRVAPTT